MSSNHLFKTLFPAACAVCLLLLFLPACGYLNFFQQQLEPVSGLRELFHGQYLQSLYNSLVLALGTAFATGIIGTMQAIILQRVHVAWRSFFLYSSFIPFLIPPYIHTLAWSRLFAADGMLVSLFSLSAISQQFLHTMLYSKTGVILIFTIAFTPLVTTIVMAGLSSVDKNLEDTAHCNNSPFRVFQKITLPLVAPHILGSCLLVSLFSLNSFDVPDILRVRVVSVEIFIQLAAMYDEKGALLLTIPLLAFGVLFAMIMQKNMRGRSYTGFAGKQQRIFKTKESSNHFAFLFLTTVWFASVALPCLIFISAIPSVAIFVKTVTDASAALLYSTLLGLSCAAVTLICSIPCAYLLARRHPFRPLLEFSALIPMAIPAALFSLGLLKAGNYFDLHWLTASSLLCLLGLTAHFFFLGVKVLQTSIEQIPYENEEAAVLMEPSPVRVLFKIVLSQIKPGLAATFFLVFICCFSELSATLLLVPPGRETISVKIYNLMHYGADDSVASLCLFIIIVVLLSALLFKICYSWAGNEHRR